MNARPGLAFGKFKGLAGKISLERVIILSDCVRGSVGAGRVIKEASEGILKETTLKRELICVSWN